MLEDNNNAQCVANLKAEIHNLQDENLTLYDKIKRMERKWDELIKQTTVLEWEVSKVRGDLLNKTSLLVSVDSKNNDLQAAVNTANDEIIKLNQQLQHKLEELNESHSETTAASDKYNQSLKVWKEEKRAMAKQREEISRKLDACEDELHAYFNENAKLEKQLKQMTKDLTSISHAHTQIQDLLDAKETQWQRFVRRLGPKHESIHEVFKAALSTGFCVVESGGLSPAGVLVANYVEYWNVIPGQSTKQMMAVINCLRDFLIEHFLDQDSVLYLLSCVSLVLFSLHSTHGHDLDVQIPVYLDDYNLLENIGLQTNSESFCGGSGYSSDSSDCNTEGTAGYTSDSNSGESAYTTDSNESNTESNSPQMSASAPKKLIRGKSLSNLKSMVKPLLFRRPPRRDTKLSKPPLMSDLDTSASSTDSNSPETSASSSPRIIELVASPRTRAPNDSFSPRTQSAITSDVGGATPRGTKISDQTTPRGNAGTPRSARPRRKESDSWEVVIRNEFEFFAELDYMFAMTVTALLKKIYKRLDEILELSHIEESFAYFCAFRANDTVGHPPSRAALGELTDLLNSLVSSFQVHMVYVALSQKIFEEIFGRLSKMLANIVISRSSVRSEMFGDFLMLLWERLEALCKGNEWTGNANKQVSLVRQCAMLLNLKDKNLVESSRKREATFPDLNENQIRHILSPEPHRPHSQSHPTPLHHSHPSHHAHHPHHGHGHHHVMAKLLLFPDLDYVRPFSIRSTHYLSLDELQRLPVPPFLVETLRVI